MDKKGLNYIDWILSMGMFLIAVIAIFIFLKPGEQPTFDNDNILTIVEDGFREATMWELKKAPLFVRTLVDNYVDSNGVSREGRVVLNVSSDWSLSIVPTGASDISISGSSPSFVLKCMTSVCADVAFELVFYPLDPQNNELSRLSRACEPSSSVSGCDAEIGASEDSKGINDQRLNTLIARPYDDIKEDWNIPESKEFAVFIDNVAVIQDTEPYAQATVFVREMHEWRLLQSGERVPVVINIRVW